MSKKTYEECYEIAKKYNTKKSFRENEHSAYARAYRNGWLKDYYWLEAYKKYSYEECKSIAEKYNSVRDLKREKRQVYVAASRYGWLKNYTWITDTNKSYTYDECLNEAKKYKTTKEFIRSASQIFYKAKRSGWLKDYIWLTDNIRHPSRKGDITYNTCMEIAKKCFCKTDMRRASMSHYLVAKKNDWLKDYTWFKGNEKWGSDAFLIYSYEDHENKYVYVGLTKDLKRRRRQHLRKHPKTHEYDVVKKHFDSLGLILPEEVILEQHLTPAAAQERERFWLQKYISNGWNGLNIAETGKGKSSLGNYAIKWTKEKCYEEAKECESLSMFMNEHNGAYQASRRNGWLDEFYWLERHNKKN